MRAEYIFDAVVGVIRPCIIDYFFGKYYCVEGPIPSKYTIIETVTFTRKIDERRR